MWDSIFAQGSTTICPRLEQRCSEMFFRRFLFTSPYRFVFFSWRNYTVQPPTFYISISVLCAQLLHPSFLYQYWDDAISLISFRNNTNNESECKRFSLLSQPPPHFSVYFACLQVYVKYLYVIATRKNKRKVSTNQ